MGKPQILQWTQGALTTTGPPPPNEVPTSSYPSETDGAFGTFVVPPQFAVRIRYLIARAEGRMQSVRLRTSGSGDRQRRLAFFGGILDESGLDDLKAFFADHKGSEIPFTWDPSPYVEYEPTGFWRLERATLRWKPLRAPLLRARYLVNFQLTEALDGT